MMGICDQLRMRLHHLDAVHVGKAQVKQDDAGRL